MKCQSCATEIQKDSKFCTQCGEKIEINEYSDALNKIIEGCRQNWYLIGFLRGKAMTGKKKKKWFEKVEEKMKKDFPEMWDEYNQTIKYWEDFVQKQEKLNG